MPKIIENLEERLIEEASKELFEKGYADMTIRTIAQNCGIAVGTVYNYYKSKDELVGQVMLRDWQKIMADVKHQCESSIDIFEGFKFMFDGISTFSEKYDPVWTQYGKYTSVRREAPIQFDWLITQLADILYEVLERCHNEKDHYISEFLAEILLNAATKQDFEYDNLSRVLKRMFG